MAFRDFTFPEIQKSLGLTLLEAGSYSGVRPAKVREEFAAIIREGTGIAVAVNTEKARSEFIVAPVLLELRRSLENSFGLFSGIEFDVDAERGLDGACDFLLTKSPKQVILGGPRIALTVARHDNVRYGMGECIAAMIAAWEFNQRAKTPAALVYGVVTTGSAWKFMHLRNDEVTIDRCEYYITDIGKIMGILTQMIRGNS